MRIVCTPPDFVPDDLPSADLNVVLYSRPTRVETGSVGTSVIEEIRRKKLHPADRAWDLLSISLSVIAADICCPRRSPDGWTREINLSVAVIDTDFWNSEKDLLERQLRFLTTDLWHIHFLKGGLLPVHGQEEAIPNEDCVVLLSGGLDSLVGALNLVAEGKKPYAVSQVSKGDKERQASFASTIGGGLSHLQLNHNTNYPGQNELSQRARSLIFLAYGVVTATALKRYREGEEVTLYVSENGFISINPPLTGARLGSLSTRTTHPVFLNLFRRLLNSAGLRVRLVNPYQFKTKGEMLAECENQDYLKNNAHMTTSCGRFGRNAYHHCGRCVPCMVRRAAFERWGASDSTQYVYDNLSTDDKQHARFDDVRSAAMAVLQADTEGIDTWIGPDLSSAMLGDLSPYRAVVLRGLGELKAFLKKTGVL